MNGIASLLDKSATVHVEIIWQELEARCGLVGVKATPFPHISWQVAEAYDLPRLETVLDMFSRQAHPLTVNTAGFGLFTGENPIMYSPIVKDKLLMNFHALLWEHVNGITIRPSL